jgi:hypothetical protein
LFAIVCTDCAFNICGSAVGQLNAAGPPNEAEGFTVVCMLNGMQAGAGCYGQTGDDCRRSEKESGQ